MESTDRERVPLTESNRDQTDDYTIDITGDLDSEPAPECCIYKVPKRFREVLEEAYNPELISIGPFHHGKKNLAKMERQKSSYYQNFLKRTSNETLESFLSSIKQNAERIYRCYDELTDKYHYKYHYKSPKFVEMIQKDAVFIIELCMRHFKQDVDDCLLKREWFRLDLRRDLMLLENQLPFFVLTDLYSLAFASPDESFIRIACHFLDIEEKQIPSLEKEIKQIKHLTDLVRCAFVGADRPNSKERISKVYNATMLHEAGVDFEAGGTTLLDVEFEKGKLKLPAFYVELRTEDATRNVMAFEQCHCPDKAYVCSYIQLLDSLIDTDEDVDLLAEKGIFDNGMGSSSEITRMINSLMEGIARAQLPTRYAKIGKDLNEYYDNSWNHTKATLRHVYFNNLWRGTGTVAAFVVVILTLTQTVLAILDRVVPTK